MSHSPLKNEREEIPRVLSFLWSLIEMLTWHFENEDVSADPMFDNDSDGVVVVGCDLFQSKIPKQT